MLIQPTLDTLNRLKLDGMAAALSEQLTQSAAMGLRLRRAPGAAASSARSSTATIGALARLLQLAPAQGSAPASRTSTTAPAAGWIAASSPSLASCDWIRQRAESADPRRHRLRQDLPGLRAGPAGVSRRGSRRCTCARRGCSTNSASVTPTAASANAWPPSPRSTCWSSTTSPSPRSARASAPICSSCSTIASAPAPRSSPASFRSRTGTTTSAIPRSPTRSSIGSCTAPTRSISRVNRCASAKPAARARQSPHDQAPAP